MRQPASEQARALVQARRGVAGEHDFFDGTTHGLSCAVAQPAGVSGGGALQVHGPRGPKGIVPAISVVGRFKAR